METVVIDGETLTSQKLKQWAEGSTKQFQFKLSPEAKEHIQVAKKFVLDIASKDDPVYGINTGFGALANQFIEKKDLATLQYNLIRSHCTGVGEPFNRTQTRAIMIVRANCLCQGHSGVSLALIEQILTFLNHDIIPFIPQKGSVGASGDLAPLSHMALSLIGEGEVFYQNRRLDTKSVLNNLNIKPCELGPKDGLALINGTTIMNALGALYLEEARNLCLVADVAAAMTVDGIKGTTRAFNPNISKVRPQAGQTKAQENLINLLKDSEILKSHPDCGKVQDPYSLRCVPQVHGACRQTVDHFDSIVQIELNSVTDNPLIFPELDDVISGGNFHGAPLSLGLDYLALGMCELASMSERRIEKLINPTFSGLPAFLTPNSGLNSGLMIAHVTAAALTSENKIYAHPACVDSIPTSTDKEDHVSMGVTAAHKLKQILVNTSTVLGIEFLAASQAIEFQRPLKSSVPIERVHELIRKKVPPIENDRVFYQDMEYITNLITNDEIVNLVREHSQGLH